jgi:tRNA modification GTPase
MDRHLADDARGERIRDGYRIAILGAPNAGKSSLLNALARREAAIVSDIPGTTRDVVEVRVVIAGYPVWFADTAGLREAGDAIESEGIRRALERAGDADLRIGVIAPDTALDPALAGALRQGDLLVLSKADLGVAPAPRGHEAQPLSVRTGEGLAALEAWLAARVSADLGASEAPALTRVRHRAAVEAARDALRAAAAAPAPELAAEDVRLAARALGRITGRIDVEDVLGEIFSSFCIGK